MEKEEPPQQDSTQNTSTNPTQPPSETSNNSINPTNPPEENDQAELSEVDLGNVDQVDFDELISFNHTYLNYRYAKVFSTPEELKEKTYGLLMANEFLSANISINLTQLTDSEVIKQLRDRLKKYSETDIPNKITFVENFAHYIKQVGLEETVDSILPIILKIPKEKDQIVERFLIPFEDVVKRINDFGEEGYKLLKEHFVNVIEEIFKYKKDERILKLNSDALVSLTKYIKEEDRGGCILTIVITMAHDDEDEKNRVLACKLFNDLAVILGQELLELYVVPQVASFADDQSAMVRKTVAGNFMNICNGVSKQCFKSRLLPVYKKLSGDSLFEGKFYYGNIPFF